MTHGTAREDVSAAQSLLRPVDGTMTSLAPGVRARAAALLLRRALERGLDDFWEGVTPDMTYIGKHRILCLEAYTGRETARRCYLTWSALSTACHYRAHELPPGPSEIRGRLLEVDTLLDALNRVPAAPSPGPEEMVRPIASADTPTTTPAVGRQRNRPTPKPGPPPGRRAAPPVVSGP